MSKDYRIIGTRPVRPDGADKVTGRARFGADIHLPGMVYAKVLRSPYPHARIRSIDASKALRVPGVVAVATGDDFPKIDSEKIAAMGEGAIGLKYMTALVMAQGKVYYKGQPVAAVAAVSPHVAAEALKEIEVDYEPLPVVDDVLEAMKDETLLHDDLYTARFGGGKSEKPSNVAAHIRHERGDVENGFAEADVVVEREFGTQMVHQGYLEPTTATAQVGADGQVTIWTSTQGHFGVRGQVASILQIPERRIRVVPMEVGGAFGGKFAVYLEPLVVLLAQKTGRPVKATMSRSEVFQATGPGSGTAIRIKIGAKKTGELTAAEARFVYDAGAFPGSAVGSACVTGLSPYRIPNFVIDGFDVVTNRPRVQAYRAPGATPAAFAVESVMDELALKIGIDPIELRLKNAVREGDRMTNDVPFPSVGFVEVLEAARAHAHSRAPLEGPNRGRGVAAGFWMNWHGRSSVHLVFNEDGTVNLIEGSPDFHGTRGSLAMIVAEELGLDFEDVHPVVADTTSVGYNDGTGGSRVTYATGVACHHAAQNAIKELKKRAAKLLEVGENDVVFAAGRFSAAGDSQKSIGIKEVIQRLGETGGSFVPSGAAGGLKLAPAFGVHIADVEVDPETGKVRILRYTAVQDVGKAIHPSAVEGQMQGGAAQGIGWALSEEYVMRDGHMMNPGFLDYRMPTALDLPMIDTVIVEVPASDGPYGVRGVGEVPIVPPPAALANAIYRAAGVRMTELPMTPERIFWAMRREEESLGEEESP